MNKHLPLERKATDEKMNTDEGYKHIG